MVGFNPKWKGSHMRKFIFALAALSVLVPAVANAHGGGCRKDSPPGQCCHAGSKPYHCH